MFSVVIPTLQRSPDLWPLVDLCVAHPLVAEVLVINNAAAWLSWESPKVRVLQQSENIFVNPAWNLGAREARGEWIAFINDDVMFETSLFEIVAPWMSKRNVGIVGPDPTCFESSEVRPWFRPAYHRRAGFGCLMFMRRDRYTPIPEDIKIWFGDDWLFEHQVHRNWVLGGFPVVSEISVTSQHFTAAAMGDEYAFNSYLRGSYADRFRAEASVYSAWRWARVAVERRRAG